ncbi:MAG: electron transport complex subunit RsxC [Oscillospiraceae bacterium]|nr:electron transport complex subunit RsxC [Oscillospiraceae bacterium]
MAGRFFGGVHPPENKDHTQRKVIRTIPPPKTVVIPMSMHVGAPCTPLVAKGDEVKLGQLIGGSEAPISAPIHSSVSGTVSAVEPRPHPNGSKVLSVVIENDFKDTPGSDLTPHDSIDALSPQELIDIVRSAGIVGLGGAGFPTHAKLSSGLGKVDTIIINGAECEPYITSGYRGMLENGDELISGARILMKVFGLKELTIGIEDNKPEAIKNLNRILGPNADGIRVLSMKTRYPQGAEKQLIQTVTGRQVPPGGLPALVGCAVVNADTAAAIHRAVYLGEPLTQKVVTVAGSSVAQPDNLRVRIGTPFSELFSECGGFKDTPAKVIMGGPMMGLAQYDLSAPVVKGTNAVLALSAGECGQDSAERSCIRCGRCVEACPMHLVPMLMYAYERKGMLDELNKMHVTDCMECGSCAFACPGRLHLVQSFKSGKQRLRNRQIKEAAAK